MKFAIIGIIAGVFALLVAVGVYFLDTKKIALPTQEGTVNEDHLYENGLDAEATILKVQEAGFATKRYTQLELLLEVQPEKGDAFKTRTKQMISLTQSSLFQPGAKLKVKYDPANQRQMALVSSPVPSKNDPKTSTQRLEHLENLKGKGLISEDEYKRKRDDILQNL